LLKKSPSQRADGVTRTRRTREDNEGRRIAVSETKKKGESVSVEGASKETEKKNLLNWGTTKKA